MTNESKQFIIEVVEALADKCTRYLHNPESEMNAHMNHNEARDVREKCLAALGELETL